MMRLQCFSASKTARGNERIFFASICSSCSGNEKSCGIGAEERFSFRRMLLHRTAEYCKNGAEYPSKLNILFHSNVISVFRFCERSLNFSAPIAIISANCSFPLPQFRCCGSPKYQVIVFFASSRTSSSPTARPARVLIFPSGRRTMPCAT